MDLSETRDFIQTVIRLGLVSKVQMERAYQKWQLFLQRRQAISFELFLVRLKVLTNSQVEKIQDLLTNGYLFCSSCTIIYPLPPSQSKLAHSYQCQKCGQPLESCLLSSSSDFPTPPSQKSPSLPGVTPPLETPATGIGPLNDSAQSLLPTPSGGYEIVKVLGKGGFGTVYSVIDPLSKRTMAIKVLNREKASNVQVQRRFLREIRLSSLLEHPNIISLYDSGHLKDGSLYFAMKELRGDNLKNLLRDPNKKESLSLNQRIEIFIKICEAMEYAHSRGVIHRDLKPENIAVDNFGEVLVLDWGIARILGEEDLEDFQKKDPMIISGGSLTQGGMIGSPGYMSPEQAQGKPATTKSDVFSLGVILYELLTLTPAFPGSVQKRLTDTLRLHPPSPIEVEPLVPPELSAIAMKALKKKPALRYRQVCQLRVDVLQFQRGYSVSALRDSLLSQLFRWIRRNRHLLVGMSAVIGVIFTSVALLYWIQQRRILSRGNQYLAQVDKILQQVPPLTPQSVTLSLKEEQPSVVKEREEKLKKLMKARRLLEQTRQILRDTPKVLQKIYQVEMQKGLLALEGKNYLLSQTSFEACLRLDKKRGKKLITLPDKKRKELQVRWEKRVGHIMKALAKKPPAPAMKDEYITEILKMRKPFLVKKLLSYLNHPKAWPRRVAVEALGKIGDNHTRYRGKDAVQWIMEKLKKIDLKKNSTQAIEMIWALGRLRDSRANQLIWKIRNGPGQLSLFYQKTELPFSWIPQGRGKKKMDFLSLARKTVMNYSKENYPIALRYGDQALKLNPKYAPSHNNRGLILMAMGRFQEALESLNRAVKLDPNYFEYYNTRGIIRENLGDYRGALEDYTRAISLKPTYSPAYNNRGSLYEKQGQYKAAIIDFTRALTLKPKSPKILSNRATAYEAIGDSQRALVDYNKAIQLNKRDWVIYSNRGNLLGKIGLWKRAMIDLNRSIALNPRFCAPYITRGLVWESRGKYDRAESDYRTALSINPKSAMAYNNLGGMYLKQKKYNKALVYFNKALSIDPKSPDILVGMANYYQKMGQWKKALKWYGKAIQLRANFMRAYYSRALLYQELKQNLLALGDFTKAMKVQPKNWEIFNARGLVHFSLHQEAKAISDFLRAIELAPKEGAAYKNIALLYGRQKKHRLASKYFRQYLNLNPGAPQAKAIQEYLRLHENK